MSYAAGDVINFAYTGAKQIVTLPPGRYKLECWGAQGGYRLARDPAEYTVGQILRLTEGSLNPVPCLDSCGGTADCLRYDTCETVDVWKQLADAINGVVDSITIADLAEKHAKRMESMNYMI